MLVTEIFHILGEVAKEEDVLLADLASDLDVGAVTGTDDETTWVKVSDVTGCCEFEFIPFKLNFMFDVPDASVPAVDMCSLMSDAGAIISHFETL
jgi:hypothetical protein